MIVLGVIVASGVIVMPSNVAAATRGPEVQADRWLEIDLYWFERGDMQGSVDKFWERFAPIFVSVLPSLPSGNGDRSHDDNRNTRLVSLRR